MREGMSPEGWLPWTKGCFVCGEANPHGLHLRSRVEGGRVVIRYTPREADLGWRHIVHGGLSMTLMDEAMTWAAILSLRRACVAAEITVRLKQPVQTGQSIRVEGWTVDRRPRLALTEGRIVDEAGIVLASGSGKYVPMPANDLPMCADDFVKHPDALQLPFLAPFATEASP
jgi:uncharacterized protein (TIGR00369 family)